MTLETLFLALYAGFLLVAAAIDLCQRRLPNRLLAAGLPLVAAGSVLAKVPDWRSALLGGAVGFLLFLLVARARPGAMGMGDVKLAGWIGLACGFPGVLWALLLAIFAGGLAAIWLLLAGKQRRQTMAYAPALALGAILALFFGPDLMRLYALIAGGI